MSNFSDNNDYGDYSDGGFDNDGDYSDGGFDNDYGDNSDGGFDNDYGDNRDQATFDDFQRVSQTATLGTLVGFTTDDRFTKKIESIILDLDEKRILQLLDSKRYIIDTLQDSKNIDYKNPYALLLGFVASNAGTGIEKSKFDSIIKKPLREINKIIDREQATKGAKDPIQDFDVLRYARYWIVLTSGRSI